MPVPSQSISSENQAAIHIALIGMSGAGKSHWSTELTTLGFQNYCCDDLIEEKLTTVLSQKDGSILSMSEWMGHPYEPQYDAAEKKYLEFEIETMQNICSYLREDNCLQKNVVVDTTGSLIYTGQKLIECLGTQAIMVYLKTPPETSLQMYETFLNSPKPVLWQGQFIKNSNETDQEALARCYPELLISRQQEYERYADVVIDFSIQRQVGFGANDFLEHIHKSLRKKS